MLAKLIAMLLSFAATRGSNLAATLIPYQVYLTPALVVVGCGIAFYLTHKTDMLGLILAALVVVNEAILAVQIQVKLAPPAKS